MFTCQNRSVLSPSGRFQPRLQPRLPANTQNKRSVSDRTGCRTERDRLTSAGTSGLFPWRPLRTSSSSSGDFLFRSRSDRPRSLQTRSRLCRPFSCSQKTHRLILKLSLSFFVVSELQARVKRRLYKQEVDEIRQEVQTDAKIQSVLLKNTNKKDQNGSTAHIFYHL